jgi:hypothetical protein
MDFLRTSKLWDNKNFSRGLYRGADHNVKLSAFGKAVKSVSQVLQLILQRWFFGFKLQMKVNFGNEGHLPK